MTKIDGCSRCFKKTEFLLCQQICSSGAIHYLWKCTICGTFLSKPGVGIYIPKSKMLGTMTEEEIDNLPVILPSWDNRCAVCGIRPSELHHWAPKSIFGKEQADKWPKDYLCDSCHKEWHRLVTPQHLNK